ncbi:MAG: IMS domain-containing protein [Leptolyngbyaceae bacterium]|nr:IMS domain-containing protein [Leptolyngbyaceae bacterium]
MQIPLDYYRILGLPIQATSEQLRHAHRDRTLQLPRREFSEAAISARRELIDEAFSVLSDDAQRRVYDARFLAHSYAAQGSENGTPIGSDNRFVTAPSDGVVTFGTPGSLESTVSEQAPISSIDIDDTQLVGALLILLELGEYELVLRLGRPFLTGGNMGLSDGRYGDPATVGADIVLTVALACLELGREQWQQGLYENAAESLETGQELLLREGLFAGICNDIQSDLCKLRPYRILELLALPDERQASRYQGIQLLQDMLNERGGIDGAGDDQSGLNTDDFLRFVQQLRSYLTAEEQQAVFEAEAQRPSAVATYLAVYALIARGFAYRLPDLLRQAKLALLRLGHRQDVALERAICVLLLGQTEEATRALTESQEHKALSFIRDNSAGSPDLLPGLCLYAERWLQNEVFPHFRDLAEIQASLKDFFADDHVQAYLEDLATKPDVQNDVWSDAAGLRWSSGEANGGEHVYHNGRHYSYANPTGLADSAAYTVGSAGGRGSSTATLDAPATERGSSSGTGTFPPPMAERISQNGSSTARGARKASRRPRPKMWFKFWERSPRRVPQTSPATQLASGSQSSSAPGRVMTPRSRSRRRTKPAGLRVDRIVFLAGIGLIGLIAFWMVLSRVFAWVGDTLAGPQLEGEQLEITLSEPFIAIPDPAEIELAEAEATEAEATGELTPEIATAVVERWLSAKVEAMGDSHNAEPLEEVLTGEFLSRWQNRSQEDARNNQHWNYSHSSVEVVDVVWSEEFPDQATIEANVQEQGELYTAGQLSDSYDSLVNVRYELVRQDGVWKIQSAQV